MNDVKTKLSKSLEMLQQLGKDKNKLQEKLSYLNTEIEGHKIIIKRLMEDNDLPEFYDDNIQMYAKFYIKTTERFNSKLLKDSNPMIYESCRKTSKRFDSNEVKKKYPDVYRSFNEIIEDKILKIEEVKEGDIVE